MLTGLQMHRPCSPHGRPSVMAHNWLLDVRGDLRPIECQLGYLSGQLDGYWDAHRRRPASDVRHHNRTLASLTPEQEMAYAGAHVKGYSDGYDNLDGSGHRRDDYDDQQQPETEEDIALAVMPDLSFLDSDDDEGE